MKVTIDIDPMTRNFKIQADGPCTNEDLLLIFNQIGLSMLMGMIKQKEDKRILNPNHN